MEHFNQYILPLLPDDMIRYQTKNAVKTMAVAYFKNNFELVVAPTQPEDSTRVYCYQNRMDPSYMLEFHLQNNTSLSARLLCQQEYLNQLVA